MKYLSVCSGMEAASVAWHPLGWFAVVTFAGPDLARFIDRVLPDEPVKAKVVNRRHR